MQQFTNLWVIHGAGRANEDAVRSAYQASLDAESFKRVQVAGYLHDMHIYSGASDVIITRVGATSLEAFAVQGKACIVVPAPFLTGGHQLKNAAYLHDQHAIEQVFEADLERTPELLEQKITSLLQQPERRAELGKTFTAFGHPQAAQELAALLLKEMNR
jgi:UDP-N-acetylglucosamine--N-acetylmuramyl-(pentapeptide) pyrophosphoryl-undecaprenol N-acetylglucosamine transferase